ncbi:MAG: dynamin family protein [Eubacteriales bacterium]|nr:dynamin family protein [Eubacteriales bacterium]
MEYGQELRTAAITQRVRDTLALLRTSEILGKQELRAESLLKKLEEERITVAVIGQFKRGKSALVNALLGEPLLPVGIVPVTSAVTEIRYGTPRAAVRFQNGLVRPTEIDQLAKYINEQENPDNHLGVSSVRIFSASPFLQEGLTFVDTPGVGSFHKHNSDTAYAFVRESDAVIFMLSVDTPINEIEIEFLQNTRMFAGKFFFVVNKIDTIDAEELKTYLDYCRDLLRRLMDTQDVTLFPLSAKTGAGVEQLKEKLLRECKTGLREILCESSRLKLRDIVVEALAQIELYWKVLLMPPAVLARTLKRMNETLEDFRLQAEETVRVLHADRNEVIPGLEEMLEARLNEYKMALTDAVTDIFGMDYHYAITELELLARPEDVVETPPAEALGRQYSQTTEKLRVDLQETLNRVLLYRNDSTVEVVTRIYELNRMTRQLHRTRDSLRNKEDL